MALHGFTFLVATGHEDQLEPTVVIHHVQGMAAPSCAQSRVAFEIHLPQLVRTVSFEVHDAVGCSPR